MTNKKDTPPKRNFSGKDIRTFADSDIFNLEPFAKNLHFLFDFPMPLTIIIDGGWGTGKTVFTTQLDNMMGKRSHYINVFAHDYQDDIFTAILLSVKKVVNPGKEEFKELFTDALLHHIVPNLTNELIKKMTGGIINIKQLAEAKAKKATNAYIENVEKRQDMLDNFRIALGQHMQEKQDTKEKEPVVILVDELDRCKPKYALQVLEIIKHLYSVPNLHFVLVMNTKQIINTVRNEHGCNEEDAKIYLQKFNDFIIPLPNIDYSLSDNANISKDNIKRYIGFKFNKMIEKLRQYSPNLIYKWEEVQPYFKPGFADLAYNQKLSLREIDKIFLQISIMACSRQSYLHIYVLASLLLIQLRESELFKKILNYYKKDNNNGTPNLVMNMEIHKFLNINSMTDEKAKMEWHHILNRNWSTEAAVTPVPGHIIWLKEHIKYLTFLNSFTAPPEE